MGGRPTTHTVFLPLVMRDAQPAKPVAAGRGLAGNPWRHGIPDRYHGAGHGIAWCHSWNMWHGVRDGVERVPMLWGLDRYMPQRKRIDYLAMAEARLPSEYDGWLIFVNEPTFNGQAWLNPNTAAWLFAEVCRLFPQAKLTSPQMALWHPEMPDQFERAQRWLTRWWEMIGYHDGLQDRLMAWAWHNYFGDYETQVWKNMAWGGWAMSLKRAEAWVTEWGFDGRGHGDGGEALTRRLAEWYDQHVTRHALYTNYVDTSTWWGALSGGNVMFDAAGTVTGIGRGWGVR